MRKTTRVWQNKCQLGLYFQCTNQEDLMVWDIYILHYITNHAIFHSKVNTLPVAATMHMQIYTLPTIPYTSILIHITLKLRVRP